MSNWDSPASSVVVEEEEEEEEEKEERRLPILPEPDCHSADAPEEAVEELQVRTALPHPGRTNREETTLEFRRRECRNRLGSWMDWFLQKAASAELFEVGRLRRRSVVGGLFLWEHDDAPEEIEEKLEEEEVAAAPVLELTT